jgi:hypothetical protein
MKPISCPNETGEIFNGCECHSTSVTGRIARHPMLPVHCCWIFCVGRIRQIDVSGGGRWSHYGGASGTTPSVVNGG